MATSNSIGDATSISLPNAKIVALNSDGTFTLPWRRYFQGLFDRGGGSSNADIIGNLNSQVTAAIQSAGAAVVAANEAKSVADDALTLAEETVVLESLVFGQGNVSSVGLKDNSSLPIFLVSGSPVTTAGTLTLTLKNQNANLVFAGPSSGGAAQPDFRALVPADFPSSGVSVGTFGDASHVGQFTVSASGLLTAASNVSIQIAESQVTGLVSDLANTASNSYVNATFATNAYVNAVFATNAYVNSTFATNSYVQATYAPLSGATFTGPVIANAASNFGSITLNSGDSTHTGYLQFITNNGTRAGYIGYAAPFVINIESENGYNYNFNGTPTINGNAIITNTSVTGGGTPGNPTANVGLSPVNGVATTYMRSDGAPALDQGIQPTWTNTHVFSNTVTVNSKVSVTSNAVARPADNLGAIFAKGTGIQTAGVVTIELDDTNGAYPALTAYNDTNWAQAGTLVKFELKNAGDSGAVLTLVNAGTGNYITAGTFTVTSSGNLTLGTVTSGVWHGTAISEVYGGTNQTAYVKGDLLAGSGVNTLSRLAVGTDGYSLVANSSAATGMSWANVSGGAGGVTSVSGTTNRVTSTGGSTPVIDISANYVGQTSITQLGSIANGTWQANVVTGTYGGTGVNNGSKTITLANNLTTSGNFTLTLTTTATTNVTLPTSGTLLGTGLFAAKGDLLVGTGSGTETTLTVGSNLKVLTANSSAAAGVSWETPTTGTVTSVSGTSNRITSTGGTTPVIDISASYVGQTSLTTLGTVAIGTWNANTITGTYGGTGVNNGSNTITLANNLVTSGNFGLTLTTTGTTNVTLPTSGTVISTATYTAKGVILVGTGAGTETALSVGADNLVLTANAAATSGVSWSAVSGSTGANPSASVGLAAVNGSATTYMRSDGAPALSQSIVPTWTGVHTFSNTVSITATAKSNALYVKGTGTMTGPVQTIELDDQGGTVNGLYVHNLGNWAHTGPLVKLQFNNATDSGAMLNLVNAGTGNYITADAVFSVTKAGGLTSVSAATAINATPKTANYTITDSDSSIIWNGAGSLTVTLPTASSYTGRWLYFKTIAAQTVVSASSNVKPLTSNTAGTAILAASKWAALQSDGTNWVIMMGN